jgi:hypothetical protein
MMQFTLIMTERRIGTARKALKIGIGVAVTLLVVSAFRMAQAKLHRSDLTERIKLQEATLKSLRDDVNKHPKSDAGDPPDDHSVARLQSEIERAAASERCTVNEFQANPDRTPYVSVFELDTKQSGWEQVSIHVTLKGTLASALHTVEALGKSSIPVEPDSVEIARQFVDQQGTANVLLRLEFRALVHAGGKA